jgi:hypothetical protein
MTVKPSVNDVRGIVFRHFQQFGASIRSTAEIDETLRIDGGKLAARSYRADGLLAMWLTEVGLLQFYDGEGNMLRTINLFEALSPRKMAA